MILNARRIQDGALLEADVAIVGAGPAGIVTALELANARIDVLIVESGHRRFHMGVQRLSDASEWDPRRHAPMSMTTRRQLGGASVIWGGRCVPYDPVDFDRRDSDPNTVWPVRYQDLVPFFQRACDWLVCGRAVFDACEIEHLARRTLVPGLPNGDVRASTLERWSLPTNFGRQYVGRLRRSGRIRLITGLTATEIIPNDSRSRVQWLETRTLDRKRIRIRARKYVLASGGLGSTRLLLASGGTERGGGLGDHSRHLGRWYAAHMEGVIANVRFTTPPAATIYGYERDIDGSYVRRRLSFSRRFLLDHKLPNIVAWLANPALADATHGNGALSIAYLALASPAGRLFAPEAQRESLTGASVPGAPYPAVEERPLRAHLQNLVRDVGPTARFVTQFGYHRFIARPPAPGFFVPSATNVYPLHYHGQHLPNAASRLALSKDRDGVGVPRLRVDLRFSPEDVDGVVRAHEHWDNHLRSSGCGRLEYLTDNVAESVWEQAGGGFHQMGTTRMSAEPAQGVVAPNLAVHGFDDLFVASSSAFVTSSQANSTFMIIVFALRLAEHLRSVLRL